MILVAALSWGLGPAPKAPPPEAYEQMAVDLLQRYLQIDTTVPPGNELKGALFFKEVLEREGIAVEVDEFSPGRANLLATLKGSGHKRPVILSNHMDVVPADPARWSVPPFSGLLKSGILYGRGAQDMKAEGIIQLLTFIRLKREAGPLDRDVMFLATADEEVDFAGALRALSPQGWGDRLRKAEYYLTEGGENLLDDQGRTQYYAVETAQKAAFWLDLKTTGAPGHGSRPIADSALNRMIGALDRVRAWRTPLEVLPSVERFFLDQSHRVPEPRASWYRDIRKAVANPEAARALYDDRDVSSLLRNTISITVVNAGYKTNVIPGVAEAKLDVRLLPGEDAQAFLAELRGVIDDPTVAITPAQQLRRSPESPTTTELFRIIERVLGRHAPGTLVTTRMASGATESALFRPLGILAYGFTPILATSGEGATAHGDDERIREDTVRRSTRIFYDVVKELCAQTP